MSRCSLLTGEGVLQGPKLPRLTSLDLSRCHALTDAGLRGLVTRLPTLRKINLSYCTELTDCSLATLSKLTELREMNLTQCKKLLDN